MRYVFVLALVFGGVAVGLLASGNRVLYWEEVIPPGVNYIHPQSGETYRSSDRQLACHYFTGRAVMVTMFNYSADNFMGRDSCPFLWKPKF